MSPGIIDLDTAVLRRPVRPQQSAGVELGEPLAKLTLLFLVRWCPMTLPDELSRTILLDEVPNLTPEPRSFLALPLGPSHSVTQAIVSPSALQPQANQSALGLVS